jgi:hypothetical protein
MRVANTTPKYSSRLAAQDNLHLKMGYVKLHEALNELERVYAKDNIIAHMVRQLGAMEDTLFEYAVPDRRK